MKKYISTLKQLTVVVAVAISLSTLSHYIQQEITQSYHLGLHEGIGIGLDTVIDILAQQKHDTTKVTELNIWSTDTVSYYLSPKRIYNQ